METKIVNISISAMVIGYFLLLIPIAIFLKLRIALVKDSLIAVGRMTLQLLFVGFYLQFVFDLNYWWLNLIWILIMMLVANFTIIGRSRLKKRLFGLPVLAAILVGSFLIILYFIYFIIKPNPFFDARYVIPLSGMILGNCLRGNVIGLERFYSGLKSNQVEYFTYLTLGASKKEAILPYFQKALAAAVSPTIATIATIGIVSLPGMMTGVILGGASPLVAIKYQIMIMLAIFSGTTLSVFLSIIFSLNISFDEYHILRMEIFES